MQLQFCFDQPELFNVDIVNVERETDYGPVCATRKKRNWAGQRLLLNKIHALSRPICYASNEYLAEQIGRVPKTVQRWVCEMERAGYLSVSRRRRGIGWLREMILTVRGHLVLQEIKAPESLQLVVQGPSTGRPETSNWSPESTYREIEYDPEYSIQTTETNREKNQGAMDRVEPQPIHALDVWENSPQRSELRATIPPRPRMATNGGVDPAILKSQASMISSSGHAIRPDSDAERVEMSALLRKLVGAA